MSIYLRTLAQDSTRWRQSIPLHFSTRRQAGSGQKRMWLQTNLNIDCCSHALLQKSDHLSENSECKSSVGTGWHKAPVNRRRSKHAIRFIFPNVTLYLVYNTSPFASTDMLIKSATASMSEHETYEATNKQTTNS
jgi:hypothetical protein